MNHFKFFLITVTIFFSISSLICFASSKFDTYQNVTNPWTGEQQKNGYEFSDDFMSKVKYHYYGQVSEWWETVDVDNYKKKAEEFMKKVEADYEKNSKKSSKDISKVSKPVNAVFIVPWQKIMVEPELAQRKIDLQKRTVNEKDEAEKSKELQTENENDKKDEKREQRKTKLFTSVKADLQNEWIKYFSVTGNNFSVMTSLYGTNDTEDIRYGAKGSVAFINLSENNTVNLTLDGDINKTIFETKTVKGVLGVNLNYLYDDFIKKTGFGTTAYFNHKISMEKAVLSYGVIGRILNLDEIKSSAGFSISYGFPIGERFALNFDTIYFKEFDATSEDNGLLNIGGILTIYMSDSFGVDIGANTTLLVKDFSAYGISLGSKYLF